MLVSKPHSVGQRASMPDYSQTIRDYANGGKAPEADPFANFLTQIEQPNPTPEPSNSSAYIDTHLGLSPYVKANIEAGLQGNEESYRQSNATIPTDLQSIGQFAPADVSAQILQANRSAEKAIQDAQLTKEINNTYRTTNDILSKAGVQKIFPNQIDLTIIEEPKVEPEPANEVHERPIRGIELKQNNGIQLFDTPTLATLLRSAIPLDSSSLNTLSRVEFNKIAKEKLLQTKDLETLQNVENKKAEIENAEVLEENTGLGDLSAKYESGSNGSSTIGYDRVGGTSYGKYQIASNTGTFNSFVNFLKEKAPDIADKFSDIANANTGSKEGEMPNTWKSVATNESERFDKLQEDFIKKSHFDPAFETLEDSGLNTESKTLQQVVWSTAVQHGATGAKNILTKALNSISNLSEKDFISSVYDIRATQFTSSTPQVREAVQARLVAEKETALAQLT